MLRPRAIHEHFVSGAYLRIYLSDGLQILHTTLLGGLVVPFGVYELWPTFGSVGPYNGLFRRFDTHFVSRADLENCWADYMTVISPLAFKICNIIANVYMITKLCLLRFLYLDLIYNIGISGLKYFADYHKNRPR